MAKLGIKRILRPLTTFPAKTKNTKDLHCKNKFCRLWGRLYQRVARHIQAIVTIAPETIKRHREVWVGPTVKRLKAAIFLVKSPKCFLREGGGFVKLQRGRTNGARLKTGSDLTVVPSWRENTSGKYWAATVKESENNSIAIVSTRTNSKHKLNRKHQSNSKRIWTILKPTLLQ